MVTAPHLRVAPQSPSSCGKEASSGSLRPMENYRSLGLNVWRLKQILPSFAFFSMRARHGSRSQLGRPIVIDGHASRLHQCTRDCQAIVELQVGENERRMVLLTQGPA